MTDITMCTGDGCPMKETCRRYLSTPSQFGQSYFMGVPVDKDGKCQYYWQDNRFEKEKTNI